MIAVIAAMSENRVIGAGNKLPWYLPADLKRFKSLTIGNNVIMGRKTYESIGKPLVDRKNIVLTKTSVFSGVHEYIKDNRLVISRGMCNAMKICKLYGNDTFLIGGSSIFKRGLQIADKMYLTIVRDKFEGDSYFPEFKPIGWEIINYEVHSPDKNNKHGYVFIDYEKTRAEMRAKIVTKQARERH